MLTYLPALVNPASVSQQVLAVAFLTSVDWSPLCPAFISWLTFSWLLSPADCPWDPPSLVLFWSRGRSRAKSFVWVSRQNRQRDPLTSTRTHRNECHPSCHSYLKTLNWSVSSEGQMRARVVGYEIEQLFWSPRKDRMLKVKHFICWGSSYGGWRESFSDDVTLERPY